MAPGSQVDNQATTYQTSLPPVPSTPPPTAGPPAAAAGVDPGLAPGSQSASASASTQPRQNERARLQQKPNGPSARSRSRTPPRRPGQNNYVENLKSSQGQNANDVYFAQLVEYPTQQTHHNPVFSFVDGSKKAFPYKRETMERHYG